MLDPCWSSWGQKCSTGLLKLSGPAGHDRKNHWNPFNFDKYSHLSFMAARLRNHQESTEAVFMNPNILSRCKILAVLFQAAQLKLGHNLKQGHQNKFFFHSLETH